MSQTSSARRAAANEKTLRTDQDPLFVDAIARAFQVLEAFATGPQARSLGEIALVTGLPKSAVQRVTHTLTRLGYMEGKGRVGFAPGRKLLDRSFDYLRSDPLFERAMPVLMDLQRETQERIDLTIFDDLTMLYVFRLQSRRETFRASLSGRRIPTWCSSGGRAVLSRLTTDAIDSILARSCIRPMAPSTITDLELIRHEIATARACGYALAAEELQAGIIAIAAPILDSDGAPIAAVHITASLADWSREGFRARFAPLVVEAAAALNAR